jgi:hypothetical protein
MNEFLRILSEFTSLIEWDWLTIELNRQMRTGFIELVNCTHILYEWIFENKRVKETFAGFTLVLLI